MPELRDVIAAELRRQAEACVDAMGDVFWDFVPRRDVPLGFRDPRDIAVEAVRAALLATARRLDPSPTYSNDLEVEYRVLADDAAAALRDASAEPTDADLQRALIIGGEWTPDAAATMLALARRHGVFTLRNALALAAALGIEDGEDGL